MALLGRPKAGDVVRAQLRIKESKEFKVSPKLEWEDGGTSEFLFQRRNRLTGDDNVLLATVNCIVLRGRIQMMILLQNGNEEEKKAEKEDSEV